MRPRYTLFAAVAILLSLAVVRHVGLATAEGLPAASPEAAPIAQPPDLCTPMKKLYARKNWRDAQPLKGENPCPNKNVRKLRDAFRLYRYYRQITPYRCHKGEEGTYAIPCYIIACESRFNWWAMNPSGASYIYQLLGWGAPPPTTFRNRVRNHEIAASLSLSNWVCA